MTDATSKHGRGSQFTFRVKIAEVAQFCHYDFIRKTTRGYQLKITKFYFDLSLKL